MADSLLETSLHPVHDLAQLPSACVAVIRLCTNKRQTRVISQKQLAQWASHGPRIVKYIYLDSINLGRVAALIG